MAFEHEQRQARALLEGIEEGTMSASQSAHLLEAADPTLVYFIFTWLRDRYPPSHPAAEGVLGRIVEICSQHPRVPRQVEAGQKDAVVEWFEDTHSYREFASREFIAVVVEKLEG